VKEVAGEVQVQQVVTPDNHSNAAAASSDDCDTNTQESGVNNLSSNLRDLHLIGDLVHPDEEDSDDSSGGEIAKNEEINAVSSSRDTVGSDTFYECNANVEEGTNGGLMAEAESNKSDSFNKDAGDGIIHDDSDDEKDSDDEYEMEPPRGIMGYSLFSKLLHMNGTAPDDEDEVENPMIAEKIVDKTDNREVPTQEQLMNPPSGIVAPSAAIPTKIMNGRKVCNLPDHPVHAGCTSVVAVIVDRTLVVANAGDSRAVLCRAGGLTEPLSFDHKPLQVSSSVFFGCASVALLDCIVHQQLILSIYSPNRNVK
jgi:hypothetical protein